MALPGKPRRGDIDPFDKISRSAAEIRDGSFKITDPEAAQAEVRKIDDILKKIAELQNTVGAIRKSASDHVTVLRRSSPKKKPQEGDVKTFQGQDYVFSGGAWYPFIQGNQPPLDES